MPDRQLPDQNRTIGYVRAPIEGAIDGYRSIGRADIAPRSAQEMLSPFLLPALWCCFCQPGMSCPGPVENRSASASLLRERPAGGQLCVPGITCDSGTGRREELLQHGGLPDQ